VDLMPFETIKCRECGSPEVTEFKAGTYVCGHCEAIFRHVSPGAASGGCEIDGCAVPAVGRCSNCDRRFCTTHQAEIATCAPCRMARMRARAAAEREDERKRRSAFDALQTASDGRDLARLLRGIPASWRSDGWQRRGDWASAVTAAWSALAERGAIGHPPTHDVVELYLHDAKWNNEKRLKYSETSRVPAWRAPHAGFLLKGTGWDTPPKEHRVDVWIDAAARVWPPHASSDPTKPQELSMWKALYHDHTTYFPKDTVLFIAVPHGAPVLTENRTDERDYQPRRDRVHVEFVDCQILQGGRFRDTELRVSLPEAVVAVLEPSRAT
jgi:hypothetical protein